jgi:hypothetical protein
MKNKLIIMKNFGNYTKIEIKKLTFEQPMD